MKFIISGKNIEITQGLRSAVESKIGKLEKYFTQETEVLVTLSVEDRGNNPGKRQYYQVGTDKQRYVRVH